MPRRVPPASRRLGPKPKDPKVMGRAAQRPSCTAPGNGYVIPKAEPASSARVTLSAEARSKQVYSGPLGASESPHVAVGETLQALDASELLAESQKSRSETLNLPKTCCGSVRFWKMPQEVFSLVNVCGAPSWQTSRRLGRRPSKEKKTRSPLVVVSSKASRGL